MKGLAVTTRADFDGLHVDMSDCEFARQPQSSARQVFLGLIFQGPIVSNPGPIVYLWSVGCTRDDHLVLIVNDRILDDCFFVADSLQLDHDAARVICGQRDDHDQGVVGLDVVVNEVEFF